MQSFRVFAIPDVVKVIFLTVNKKTNNDLNNDYGYSFKLYDHYLQFKLFYLNFI